ncbi:MAG: class I SAM-dependent methyltransferase, partial [Treponema sp.]|nr:class I SAM-dependent methyltransferase [Treponema sp.]
MTQADFQFNRQSFDAVSSEYTNARPDYDERLFQSIDTVRHFTSHSRILELGAGTGIATRQMADLWHPDITAVEPGENLIAEARKRLAGYNDITFYNTSFESYDSGNMLFDAVVSATSFHWLDPDTKYRKSSALLRDGGVLIVFWNYYGRDESAVSGSIDRLYEKYGMSQPGIDMRMLQQEKIESRTREIRDNGYFDIIKEDFFTSRSTYTAARYISLLKTFSDHSRVPHIHS